MAEESITDKQMTYLREQGFKGSFLDMERQRLCRKMIIREPRASALSIKDLYRMAGERPWNVQGK